MIAKLRQQSRPVYEALLRLLRNRLFMLTTVLPTVLALIYFGLIASDIYVSESRFVVRSSQPQENSPLGLILRGTGFSRAQDDSYTVQDFVLSRDALKTLNDELHLAKDFGSHEVDPFSRFAGLDWDDSLEALYLYYQRKVSAQLDPASSITALTTRAFTAKDAYDMNRRLLELSEALVNKLNERGRRDMILFAAKEVADAELRAKSAALALAGYRNEEGVIDPEKQATIPLTQISKLQEDLVNTKALVAQLDKVANKNPQLPILRQRVGLLANEIEAEKKVVAGGGHRSLSSKAAEFQRLAVERDFADKMLASTMSTLEQARSEAQRQQLYLERIAQPSLPDHAIEPRRLRSILAVFVLGLVAWGVLTMLIAGIKEHQD